MRHEMKLFSRTSFEMISNGIKTVEVRLLDEKRSKLKLGDEIIFTGKDGATVLTQITGLCHFIDFKELFKNIDPVKAGYEPTDTVEYAADWMHSIYTPDEIKQYGALGIIIKKVDNHA